MKNVLITTASVIALYAGQALAFGDIDNTQNNSNTAFGGAGGNATATASTSAAAIYDPTNTNAQEQNQLQHQRQHQAQGQAQKLNSSNTATNTNNPIQRASTGPSSAVADPTANPSQQFKDSSKTTAIAVAPPSFSYNVGGAVGQEYGTEGWAFSPPLIGGGFGDTEVVPTGSGAIIHAHNLVSMLAAFETGPEDTGDGSATWSNDREYGRAMYAVYCSNDLGRSMVKTFMNSSCH